MTKVIQLKPKYILQNSSQFIFFVIQANTQKLSREILLNNFDRAPLFSNDSSLESPKIRFRVKDHDWSDTVNLEKPMLIFIALQKKLTEDSNSKVQQTQVKDKCLIKIESNSGFKIEQYTNFNIQMTFSSDSYLLLMRQDDELSPIQVCNDFENCVILVSQDPAKLRNKVAELSLMYGEKKQFSWARPFSLEKQIYMVVYNIEKKMYSSIFMVNTEMSSNNYNVSFSPDFASLMAQNQELDKNRNNLGFQMQNQTQGKIYHFSKVSGVANKIVICEMINDDLLKGKVESRMVLIIPNLGVSVIGGQAQRRKELMYINVHNLDYSAETTADEYTQEIAISSLNIDNNYDHFACYPVMLAPKYPLNYINQKGLRHIDVYLKSAINSSDVRILSRTNF